MYWVWTPPPIRPYYKFINGSITDQLKQGITIVVGRTCSRIWPVKSCGMPWLQAGPTPWSQGWLTVNEITTCQQITVNTIKMGGSMRQVLRPFIHLRLALQPLQQLKACLIQQYNVGLLTHDLLVIKIFYNISLRTWYWWVRWRCWGRFGGLGGFPPASVSIERLAWQGVIMPPASSYRRWYTHSR